MLLLSCALNAEERDSPLTIRTELFVVEVPQSTALAMRRQLTNDVTVESAVQKLLEMARSGAAASLIGTAVTWNLSGERGVTEMNEEVRNGTPFEPPRSPSERAPDIGPAQVKAFSNPLRIDIPTTIESRNAGLTLDVESTALDEGRNISLSYRVERVWFVGLRPTLIFNQSNWRFTQPIYRSFRIRSETIVPSRAWKLAAFNLSKGIIPRVELVLIRATALRPGS
jgi:hypothetical protein